MSRKNPSLRNFFLSFSDHWAQLMSGGFSVPFAVLAWQLDGIAKAIFGVMAILAFTFAAYRVWASERKALNKAGHRIKELESEYPYSLHLGSIDFNLLNIKADAASAKLKERKMGFTLHLRNTLHKPLEYNFERIAIDGAETSTTLADFA